jgi:hypothetical protein
MAQISEFKAMMVGGGARPNQFRVELGFPSFVSTGAVVGLKAMFLCKAAQLPASTIEDIAVQYRGRPVHFAGERTFAPWTITVYNDTDFAVRNALEVWSNGVQNLTSTNGITNPRDYQSDMNVNQLDRNGAVIKSYKFIDAYPVEISAIQLDYETGNQIETFDVTFQYNYWTTSVASSSRAGGNLGVNIGTPIGTIPINI